MATPVKCMVCIILLILKEKKSFHPKIGSEWSLIYTSDYDAIKIMDIKTPIYIFHIQIHEF